MLVVARQQLEQARDREIRAQQARRRREMRTAMRRDERDAARAEMWHERLMPAREPRLTAQERVRRIAQALASKGYKIQVKDSPQSYGPLPMTTSRISAGATAFCLAKSGSLMRASGFSDRKI